jgi:hypothetical protein
MLFLAVFCGFLAEYQLEHKIEKERGKQYLRSFVEDLRADTAIYTDLIMQYEEKLVYLRTMEDCYYTVRKNPNDSCLMNLFITTSFFPDLINTDRTLQQLKNAGGLRLIPAEAADSIIEYDKLLRLYQKQESTAFQETQTAIRASIVSLGNFEASIRQFSPGSFQAGKTINTLSSTDIDPLNRYFNLLIFYVIGVSGNIDELHQLQSRATNLMSFFNKKYNIK